ncbi:MAG: PLDc N-terminal domain-containing protein, partial [Gemmiger sp.]
MPAETEEKRQTMKNSVGRGALVALCVLLQVGWIVWLVARLNEYYAYISLFTSLLSLLVVLHISGNRINSAYKLSWIVLILLFPVLGLCLFLLFGQESSNLVMRRKFGRVNRQMADVLTQDPEAVTRLAKAGAGLANQATALRKAGYPV